MGIQCVYFERTGIWVNFTILLKALVWILLLHHNSLISNILKGIIHQPAITTIISIAFGAVDQLLLTELD
jgi:hypothetical protein